MQIVPRKLRVLIVDDSGEDRELYKRLMTQDASRQFVFTESELGESGLFQFQNEKPDCVLLDYNLPDIDGLEFLERLSSENGGTFAPVVMLTGQGNEKVAVDAMKCGAQDYLIKGLLTPEGLRLAIDNAMSRVALQTKARELEMVKSEFLSTASHELRTPLTIIREFASLVRDGIVGPVNPEQKECLDSALQNCDRLSNLINDILDLRRIEAGDPGLRRARVSLQIILENCRRDFQPQCERKQQHFFVNCPSDLPPVLCDADRMTQVLVNLIGNAHKFTPDYGQIVINAMTIGDQDGFVRLDICDSGPGINLEDQERVFEKFTQIGRQHGPGAKGTGLGLAIVKNIVAMHGGEINVTSALDTGCTFAVTIPKYTEARETIAFLEDHLLAATAAGAELSVIALKLNATGGLQEVETTVRELLRRKDDATLLAQSEGMVFIVAQTNGKHDNTLRSRIVQNVAATCPVTGASMTFNALSEVPEQLTKLKSLLAPVKIQTRVPQLADFDVANSE